MQKPATPSNKSKAKRHKVTPVHNRLAHDPSVPLIRINFDISRAEHTKLKIYAAKKGCSMADLLRTFVAQIKLSNVK
jgi:hypothetical protein